MVIFPTGHSGGTCQHRGAAVDVPGGSGLSISSRHGGAADGLGACSPALGLAPGIEGRQGQDRSQGKRGEEPGEFMKINENHR